jgi:hypothetical protein
MWQALKLARANHSCRHSPRARPPGLAHATQILVTLVFLAGCGGKQLGDDYTDTQPTWGTPANDLQIGLATRTYDPGKAPDAKQIYYVAVIRNIGKKSIKVLRPVEPRFGQPQLPLAGDESAMVQVKYESGAGSKTATYKPSKKPITQELAPGEAITMELRLSPARFGLDRFVDGKISASYSNQQTTIEYGAWSEGPASGIWTGEITSGELPLE